MMSEQDMRDTIADFNNPDGGPVPMGLYLNCKRLIEAYDKWVKENE